MKTHYYVLAEHDREGYVFSEVIDDKNLATNMFVSLNGFCFDSGEPTEIALGQLNYLKKYSIPESNTMINMNGMIVSNGKVVNTYLIESKLEITDFNTLPRVDEQERLNNFVSDCDFPF